MFCFDRFPIQNVQYQSEGMNWRNILWSVSQVYRVITTLNPNQPLPSISLFNLPFISHSSFPLISLKRSFLKCSLLHPGPYPSTLRHFGICTILIPSIDSVSPCSWFRVWETQVSLAQKIKAGCTDQFSLKDPFHTCLSSNTL